MLPTARPFSTFCSDEATGSAARIPEQGPGDCYSDGGGTSIHRFGPPSARATEDRSAARIGIRHSARSALYWHASTLYNASPYLGLWAIGASTLNTCISPGTDKLGPRGPPNGPDLGSCRWVDLVQSDGQIVSHAESQSEWLTRKRRIDPILDALGWRQGERAMRGAYRIEEYQTDNGPADYALCCDAAGPGHRRGQEAHPRPAERPDAGRALRPRRHRQPLQLRRPARPVPLLHQRRGHLVPRRPPPAEPLAQGRLLPHARRPCGRCWTATSRPPAAPLQATPNNHPRLRPYQIEANTAIEQAIADRKREMLLAMATGTGKTFTLVNQVYRLMKSGVGPPRALPGGPPRPGRPGRPGLRELRARARAQVRPDLRGLQPARSSARTSTRTRSSTPRSCPPTTCSTPSPAMPSSTSAPSSAWP